MINKNIFKITFLFLILAEILSFFGWLLPSFNVVCFCVILILTLIFSLVKLEYGIYILLAELFIGSKGYLFSLEFNETLISIRIGLFLIIFSVWFVNFLKTKNKKEYFNFKFNKNYLWLGIVILWSFVWGIIRGNNFGNVFLDFNNWLYFLLILPFFSVAKNNDNFLKNILTILIASVLWIGIKSLILLYIFSHEFIWALPEVYKWVRDTGVGEVTFAGGGFWRVFIQSQVYSLLTFFIIFPFFNLHNYLISNKISSFKLKIKKNNLLNPYFLILTACLTTILLSFSRSYWVALIFTLLIYYFVILFLKIKFLDFLKINVKIIIITIISFAIVFLVINLPPKIDGGNLASMLGKRATEMEASSSSRINQLKPLLREIAKHPVIGSGFGTTVTYFSNDPRIVPETAGQTGEFTTYSFEWGYLDLILKFGVVGFCIYLFLIFKILRKLFDLRFGFFLALISLLIVNIFSPYLNHPLGIGFLILASVVVENKNLS